MEAIPLTDKEFKNIRELVYQCCRINLSNDKRELVRNRLGKRMRQLSVRSYQDYFDRVVADPSGDELTMMLNCITTNLTSFYREKQHFDFVTEHIVPDFLDSSTGRLPTMRVWSAACSTGEEPYSLAMCLLDAFGTRDVDLKILATDLSSRVLEHAMRGQYPSHRVAPLPPALRNKYMTRRTDGDFEAAEVLRKRITFRRLNLAVNRFPFKHKFDIVFCRNVMIYFDRPTQEKLVSAITACLNHGGHLFVGHSESLTGLDHPLTYVRPTAYKPKRSPRAQAAAVPVASTRR